MSKKMVVDFLLQQWWFSCKKLWASKMDMIFSSLHVSKMMYYLSRFAYHDWSHYFRLKHCATENSHNEASIRFSSSCSAHVFGMAGGKGWMGAVLLNTIKHDTWYIKSLW